MEKIILILGEQTEEIRRTLSSHYSESIEVVNSFKHPSEFAEYYKKTPLRVSRILISESSFSLDEYTELSAFKKTLENFYVAFDQVFFLISNREETKNLLTFLIEDETFPYADRVKVFNHEIYTPTIVINYSLNKIARKHHIEVKTEYDEIVRKRKDADTTFKLEEDDVKDSEIVVLDSDNVSTKQIRQKLKNLSSLSNVVKGDSWENNKIIKDIYKIEELMTVGKEASRFEIDFSNFYLNRDIKTFKNNIIIVTGEKRSGKSVMAYSLSKSASIEKKVLLVDLDTKNLGLSHLTETLSDRATVMLLQDFKHDFKNALRTLVRSSNKLNVIVSNTKTNKELGNIDPTNFLSMIINTCSKYFDNIIFDIPLTNINNIIPLMKKSEKIVITVPTNLNNVVSTLNLINELNLTKDFDGRDLLFIPVDMYNKVSGTTVLDGENVKSILRRVFTNKVKVMPELEIGSFELDESLFRAVKSK